jgi:hypothetical protein
MAKRPRGEAKRERWTKSTLKLPPDHAFRAAPGNKLLVLDRGRLWIEYPADWHMAVENDTFSVMDRKPPKDDCRLDMSLLPLPPLAQDAPIDKFLLESLANPERQVGTPEHATAQQSDVSIVWVESRWVEEERAAASRSALAKGRGELALLTFTFWETTERGVSLFGLDFSHRSSSATGSTTRGSTSFSEVT